MKRGEKLMVFPKKEEFQEKAIESLTEAFNKSQQIIEQKKLELITQLDKELEKEKQEVLKKLREK